MIDSEKHINYLLHELGYTFFDIPKLTDAEVGALLDGRVLDRTMSKKVFDQEKRFSEAKAKMRMR